MRETINESGFQPVDRAFPKLFRMRAGVTRSTAALAGTATAGAAIRILWNQRDRESTSPSTLVASSVVDSAINTYAHLTKVAAAAVEPLKRIQQERRWGLSSRRALAQDPSSTQQGENSDEHLRSHFRGAYEHAGEERTGSKKRGAAPVWRIAVTGGPCGGKSTAMHHLQQRLTALGFRVFVVPESATLVITGGGMYKSYGQFTSDQSLAFEASVMKTKMALEDAFVSIAEASGEPSVVLCDRGTMDTKAYLSKSSWHVLMDEYDWNVTQLRDRRYDAVIHLVTAAIGAEQYYTTENNTARTETPQQARELDFKVLNSWVGHPQMRIVDNSTGFDGKIKRTIEHVCKVVGAPKPASVVRKFLVTGNSSDFAFPPNVDVEEVTLEQTYLVKGKAEGTKGFIFVRRRGQNGGYTYSHSVRRDVGGDNNDDVCIVERQISGREYIALLKQADPARQTVTKMVKCFVHNNQYFELQSYVAPDCGVSILQCESETVDSPFEIPPWLKVQKEVTTDADYSSFIISRDGSVPNKTTNPTPA